MAESKQLTETTTVRLTLAEKRAIEEIAISQNITKSVAMRQVIKKGLSKSSNFNQRMLIEMLMILRSSIDDSDDSDDSETLYARILQNVDRFKEAQGLD